MRWLGRAASLLLLAAAVLVADEQDMQRKGGAPGGRRKPDPGCISCHQGSEVMHPWDPLSCADCRQERHGVLSGSEVR
ncbi:MAG: hypothetical protein ACYS0K_21735 [Planctomycetota bacterium]